jgi:uncharacterized repeat protein (TIGR03803 family)
MKTHIKNLFTCLGVASTRSLVLSALMAGLGLMLALPAAAQTFTTLHIFTPSPTNSSGVSTNSDGSTPYAGVILSGNTLYGTTHQGGTNGSGTVFAVNTDGTGFTNLHSFASGGIEGSIDYPPFETFNTNSDRAYPNAGVILSGNTLYGVAVAGGTNGTGTVFAVNTNGTVFTVLHTFTAAFIVYGDTNSDGANPDPELILSGNTLYGTANAGGLSGNGALFAINTDGTGFTNLYNFTATSGNLYTNSDGSGPTGLILSGHTLYGTAGSGGAQGYGDVFALNIDGTDFATLHTFASGGYSDSFAYTNSDGTVPVCELALSGNTLYGTASQGGSSGNGTVFSLSFAPQLTITLSGTNVILTWPTNYAGFDYSGFTLEFATNLVSPIAWNANLLTGQAVIGGQNVVTNPITGSQMFYRLARGQNFGVNWVGLRTAMKAAGAFSYGHQSCLISGPEVCMDMFYLPVPTRVIELANANPTLCSFTISTTSGPAPDHGCALRWEGGVGPQLIGSRVIVLPRSATLSGPCQCDCGWGF